MTGPSSAEPGWREAFVEELGALGPVGDTVNGRLALGITL